ncbi:MAG: roadblock/LC7 domain-containing protein [Candidatus Hodarchaeota archaeon]
MIELPAEIEGAIICSLEGNPISAEILIRKDEHKIAAMMLALGSVAKAIIKEIKQGKFKFLRVRAKGGNIFIFPISNKAVFAAFTKVNVDFETVYMECKMLRKKIEKLLQKKLLSKPIIKLKKTEIMTYPN